MKKEQQQQAEEKTAQQIQTDSPFESVFLFSFFAKLVWRITYEVFHKETVQVIFQHQKWLFMFLRILPKICQMLSIFTKNIFSLKTLPWKTTNLAFSTSSIRNQTFYTCIKKKVQRPTIKQLPMNHFNWPYRVLKWSPKVFQAPICIIAHAII